jgi:intracellular septation protein
MHVITLLMITVLGGATLIFHDDTFIKWKVSVVNWLFGIAFLGSQFIGKKPIIQRMMEASVELPQKIWTRLNLVWALFFISTGFLNLYVAYNYDLDTWVNFKMFGMLGLTFLFILAQALFIGRYVKEPDQIESPSTQLPDKTDKKED